MYLTHKRKHDATCFIYQSLCPHAKDGYVRCTCVEYYWSGLISNRLDIVISLSNWWLAHRLQLACDSILTACLTHVTVYYSLCITIILPATCNMLHLTFIWILFVSSHIHILPSNNLIGYLLYLLSLVKSSITRYRIFINTIDSL